MTSRWRRTLGLCLLALWTPLLTLLVAVLMVDHVAPLPPLGDRTAIRQGLARRFGDGGPVVVHLVAAGCTCTRGLLRHLDERGARPGHHEVVWFVGPPPDEGARLAGRGYALDVIDPVTLRRDFAIEGAPVLLVRRDDGTLGYAGGYFDVPAAVHARDERILDAVAAGQRPPSLPLFGCAVDPALVARRDPTALRRALDHLDEKLGSWLRPD